HEDPEDEEENDQGFGGSKRKRAFLTLDPNGGSLWLARHKDLYRYDREAHLLERIRLPKRAKALAVDPTRGVGRNESGAAPLRRVWAAA
ncbi:MAG: hypothetical protein ACREX9_09680, partial [Gammaproteobacteria bacterium]